PENARNFTAVGYFFAREINKVTKIPIGLIHSSVGATAAEVWISGAGLHKYMPYDFHEQLAKLARDTGDPAGEYFQDLEKWAAAVDPESAQLHYTSDSNLNTGAWQEITVPKTREEPGATNFNGLAWFRTELDIPADWAEKPLSLVLGQIKNADITWFNGTLIGCTQGHGFRRYQIDGAMVKPGGNLLTVAVFNTNGPSGFSGNPKYVFIRPAGDSNAKGVSGIWKSRQAVAMKNISLPFPRPKLGYYKTITAMYNGMIAPLTPFAIKGALWYQGAASWPFWLQYRRLLPALIADWRDQFQAGDFPFLIVSQSTQSYKQSHPIEAGYGEIRESQWRTARKVPNTRLVITADIGYEPVANIHPKNKQETGRRLSLAARNLCYGEKELVYSGPEYTEMMLERNNADTDPVKTYQARLYFKHLGGGLVFKPGPEKPNGFVVAGEDNNFVWADAVIEGDSVVVSSPEIAVPRHVRYGWAYNPIITLFNKEGLPAIPFRTDE
ncbi:MAG: sugar-binding domain-containing protein, partial [bacterium]